MRFLLRTALVCSLSLCMSAAIAALPAGVTLTVHGDFDPGTSGGTAVNSATSSSLSIQTATLIYDSSDVDVSIGPGDTMVISLGTLYAVTGQLLPVSFNGAKLDLTIEVTDPPAAPTVSVFELSITGNVGEDGETLLLAERTGIWADFLTTPCVPRILSVLPDAVTTVVSGAPPEDVGGKLHAEYAVPVEPGDVDGDGSVTLIDAVRGLQMLAGIDESQCDEVERGDMEGNGVLDLVNVVRIARKSYGLI